MKTYMKGRSAVVVLVLIGTLFGAVLVAPVGAHVGNAVAHLWQGHLKEKVSALVYTKSQSDARYIPATQGSGLALAGVEVHESGSVLSSFNRFGGVPVVTHIEDSGRYVIDFPGLSLGGSGSAFIAAATLIGQNGDISYSSIGGDVIIYTFDSAGSPADRGFGLVIHGSTPPDDD